MSIDTFLAEGVEAEDEKEMVCPRHSEERSDRKRKKSQPMPAQGKKKEREGSGREPGLLGISQGTQRSIGEKEGNP
jgi:hypothetical protein